MTGPGWGKTVHTFYSLSGASHLAGALAEFNGGRLVVNMVDLPIKCPVAPLEFCFLADSYMRKRGIRDRVEITFVTPLDGAFTKPAASRALAGLLTRKNIHVVTDFATGEIDDEKRKLISYDQREVPYDLAVVIPLHGGAAYVSRSKGLGDELGFIPTNENTMQSKVKPNIFAIGDATDVRASKAGSVAHFEGAVVERNVVRFLEDLPLDASFDGHTNCFIETGNGKALLIDFNYELEPVPGHFPSRLGLPLLKESRLNHVGKLAFEKLYWHAILPGRDIPLIGHNMPTIGKDIDAATPQSAPQPAEIP